MRPFVFFSIFTAAAFVAADHTVLIDNLDKQISYSNGWKSVSSRVIHLGPIPSSYMVNSDKF